MITIRIERNVVQSYCSNNNKRNNKRMWSTNVQHRNERKPRQRWRRPSVVPLSMPLPPPNGVVCVSEFVSRKYRKKKTLNWQKCFKNMMTMVIRHRQIVRCAMHYAVAANNHHHYHRHRRPSKIYKINSHCWPRPNEIVACPPNRAKRCAVRSVTIIKRPFSRSTIKNSHAVVA